MIVIEDKDIFEEKEKILKAVNIRFKERKRVKIIKAQKENKNYIIIIY